MKTVVLITQHYLSSKRKAGFHWLANAYHQHGWEVVFFTCYISPISFLRGERRFPRPLLRQVAGEARQVRWVDERLASYVWFTPWHPANLRLPLLNAISRPLFRAYGRLSLGPIEPIIRRASLFIFEPTPGLLLFERFKQLNPGARFVYRASDDLKLLGRHPVVLEAEDAYAPRFDMISTPCEYLHRHFSHLPSAQIHYHGVETHLFDGPHPNPYSSDAVNAVYVGHSMVDTDFYARASAAFPDWRFHVIGAIDGLPEAPNIIRYGEMPFAATIPYVKHADVGLQTRLYSPGAESLTDSLKVQQYTYCRLPIVAPDFLRCSRNNMFYYTPGDDSSIESALKEAIAFDRDQTDLAKLGNWQTMVADLAGELWDAGTALQDTGARHDETNDG